MLSGGSKRGKNREAGRIRREVSSFLPDDLFASYEPCMSAKLFGASIERRVLYLNPL